jgi:hypothetical protein
MPPKAKQASGSSSKVKEDKVTKTAILWNHGTKSLTKIFLDLRIEKCPYSTVLVYDTIL